MNIIDHVVKEFEYECGTTRKLLERVPDADLGWKPHAKSFSMGQLASHLAEIPSWGSTTIEQEEFSFKTGEFKAFSAGSTAELLAKFDEEVKKAVEAMRGASNETVMANWSLKVDGNTIFTMPRIAVLRTWVLNHMVHHRGQLSVYLRLREVPLPSIYGPTADDQG